MVFELWRFVEENEMLRKETERYQKDVNKLIETGQLGHQNAKQKLQYHLRQAMCQAVIKFQICLQASPAVVPDRFFLRIF